MKHNLKFMVICFLKALPSNKYDQFNEAFDFYKKSENKSISVETKINRTGFSEQGLENLLYDLKQVYSITDLEIATTEVEEVKTEPDFLEEINAPVVEDDLDRSVAIKVLVNTDEYDTNHYVESTELEPLRTEFPFLNDKDCPEVMFVVVGKRISAYRRYQNLHGLLQEIIAGTVEATEEEQAKTAQLAQEANAENIALWNELNHYNTTGEILGKHPLFREMVAKREVDAMTIDELAKYRVSSATFVSKKRTALKEKGLTDEKKAELEEAIADREYKLGLVNTKLGADAKK
jgi:hypothetical protein